MSSLVDTKRAEGRRPSVFRRFTRKRSGVIGLIMLAVPLVAGLCAPLLTALEGQDPYTFHTELLDPNGGRPLGPLGGVSAEHWLGVVPVTGVDLFAQIVFGIRSSLFIAFGASIIAIVFAAILGTAMGYFGGFLNAAAGRVIDFMFGFPGLMFVIAIMVIVPPEFPRELLLVLVLAFFGWIVPARIIGAQAGAINARAFVEAARATGAPPWQIIRREMLPHLFSLVVVLFAMALPANVSTVAGLSFLGVGLRGDVPDLGKLLADSLPWIYSGADVWYMFFPGAVVFCIVFGATLAGDALRDVLDVRTEDAA
ncbi:peptide/nickel transport system permease protein [Microterricola gilva]|uniref:Peptide/nickel transport system permease protein n=1 Tax=Microterricola gilva TaxID=393267 RepID=A0A4Q8AQS1_9MICO|nr:ABC transporter permease [Microterricola gilva]RZU66473.1 peptide/nickel transport system permease protein [Microterricola gilva]